MKKKKVIIIAIILLLFGLLLSFILFKFQRKEFNVEKIKDVFLEDYSYYYQYDQYDISNYFGMIMDEDTSYVFLGDFDEDVNNPRPFSPQELIIAINGKEADNYYEVLQGYIDSNRINVEDSKLIKMFDKAILKKGNNYAYLILGTKLKEKEEKLLNYLK